MTPDVAAETGLDIGRELRRRVAREQAVNRLPSLVVGVAQQGRPMTSVAVGDADSGQRVAATVDTPYRIGSITKTLTAAVVLSLAERGDLDLDAPVGKYLPDTSFGSVSLRLLLAHAGGLQREVPVNMWASMHGPDRKMLIASLQRVRLVARPGTRWHYSNLGYAVLGQIVSQVAGTACTEVIDRELLAPLGMRATSWSRPPGSAVGYRIDAYADTLHAEPDMDQAAIGVAGQLWSTPGDLLRWGDALAGGVTDVLSVAVVDAMHTVHVMVDETGWTSAWGLGLTLTRTGSRLLAGHTGAMPGFLAALCVDRETRTAVVALTNATRGIALGTLATDLTQAAADAAPPIVTSPWRPATPCPPELEGLLGLWWSESDEYVFSWRADGLHACVVRAGETTDSRFAHDGSDFFVALTGPMQGEQLIIRRSDDGSVAGVEWATYPFTRSQQ